MSVLDEVAAERARQDARWGEQNHPDGTDASDWLYAVKETQTLNAILVAQGWLTWRNVLEEEVYEAFAETDPAKLREELIQVAAVAVAWIEAIDRRRA